MQPRPRRPSPRAAHIVASRPGCSASPACRWSRAPRSASTTPRPAATRSMPAPAARSARGTTWRRARRPGRAGAHGDARRRRQFRHPRRLQSGIRAGRLGGAARRPPGQMDLRAQRGISLRLSGARSRGRRRTGARRATARSSRCAAPTSSTAAPTRSPSARLHKGVEIMSSIYHVPAVHFRARAALTNTAPTRPYRSSGRPEVDVRHGAADRPGGAAVRLRPHRTAPPQPRAAKRRCRTRNPFGMVYDSGAYHRCHGARARTRRLGRLSGAPQAEARERGKCRGIGVANYVDTATGVPRERAEITVQPDGT